MRRKFSEKRSNYFKFFEKTLDDFGVDTPADLSPSEKAKFFSALDAGWVSEKEEKYASRLQYRLRDEIPDEFEEEDLCVRKTSPCLRKVSPCLRKGGRRIVSTRRAYRRG